MPGDTLSGIAASHGVTLAAVEAANPHLSNPDMIYVGQKIEIPGGSSASQSSYHSHSHVARHHNGRAVPVRQSAPSRVASAVIRSSSGRWSGYSSSSLSDIP